MTTEELQTRITRGYGVSAEDATKIIKMVAQETMEQYLSTAATPESVASPTFMQTTVGVGEQAVTRTWVNVEAIAEQVAPQVTEMVANALADAMEGRR